MKNIEMLTSPKVMEFVSRVYSGRPGCACGCRGNYRATKAWAHAHPEVAEYRKVVNEVQVKKVVNILRENLNVAKSYKNFLYIENLNGRTFTVYFKEKE